MKTMFVYIAIATLISVSFGRTREELEAEMLTWGKECQDDPKYHIDDATLQKYINESIIDLEGLDKHFRCMLTKMGVLKENGDVIPEGLRKRMSEEFTDKAVLDQLVNECAQQKGTPEETALYIRKCIEKFRDAKEVNES